MKAFIIFVLLTTATLAQATQLFSTYQYTNDQGQVISETTHGFSEDGFSSPTSVCFRGDINNVCTMINRAADALGEEYSSGGHGHFVVNTCAVSGDEVKLDYNQVNDWEDTLDIKLTITKCSW